MFHTLTMIALLRKHLRDFWPWLLHHLLPLSISAGLPKSYNDRLYQRLGHRQVRVLKPEGHNLLLEPKYTLHVVSIDDLDQGCDTVFRPLSYMWGCCHRNKSAIVNGQRVDVTLNLKDFLKRPISRAGALLWIDAICINQNDIQERAQQVKLMSQIYSSAYPAIIWLGSGDRNLEKFLEAMVGFGNAKRQWRDIDDAEIYELVHSLKKFCSLEYWSRMWIAQEIILPKHLLLAYGSSFIEWKAFWDEVDNLCLRHDEQSRHILHEELENLPAFLHFQQRNDRMRSLSEVTHGMLDLRGLLEIYAFSQCSENADRLIALLSLVDDNQGFSWTYEDDAARLTLGASLHFSHGVGDMDLLARLGATLRVSHQALQTSVYRYCTSSSQPCGNSDIFQTGDEAVVRCHRCNAHLSAMPFHGTKMMSYLQSRQQEQELSHFVKICLNIEPEFRSTDKTWPPCHSLATRLAAQVLVISMMNHACSQDRTDEDPQRVHYHGDYILSRSICGTRLAKISISIEQSFYPDLRYRFSQRPLKKNLMPKFDDESFERTQRNRCAQCREQNERTKNEAIEDRNYSISQRRKMDPCQTVNPLSKRVRALP